MYGRIFKQIGLLRALYTGGEGVRASTLAQSGACPNTRVAISRPIGEVIDTADRIWYNTL